MSIQEHKFLITVSGCTAEQAGQVMGERIGYDEDYGFEYQIEVANAPVQTEVVVSDEMIHLYHDTCSAHNDDMPAREAYRLGLQAVIERYLGQPSVDGTVEMNVQLPQRQIPYITELSRLSGQPVEAVIAVLLAVQTSREKLAEALAQKDGGYTGGPISDGGMDPRDRPATKEADDSAGLYYLQDSRSYVGNCPMWWGPFGCGYTTRLDRAHRYTYEQAMKQHRIRSTDIPWPCSKIDPLRRPTIDMQDLGSVRDQIARLNDNQLGQT